MKKIIFLLLITLPFFSCYDDENSTPTPQIEDKLSTAPEAKSEYDASNFGVYKGIFVGSSGTVYVNIYNSGSVSAKMVIDGITYEFKTTEAISEGKAISGLTFSNETSSFDFSVQANGEYPLINNLNISGHAKPHVQLFKEYSFAHIKCYLGTFSGDKNGILNLATTSDGYALGLAAAKGDLNAIYMDGSIDNATIKCTYEGGEFSATVKNNKVIGTWKNDTPQNGSWTATRKL